MTAPTTGAGRRLLNDWPLLSELWQMQSAILAIEAEARADLARRIEAVVEALDKFVYDGDACLLRDEVLAAIREELGGAA